MHYGYDDPVPVVKLLSLSDAQDEKGQTTPVHESRFYFGVGRLLVLERQEFRLPLMPLTDAPTSLLGRKFVAFVVQGRGHQGSDGEGRSTQGTLHKFITPSDSLRFHEGTRGRPRSDQKVRGSRRGHRGGEGP